MAAQGRKERNMSKRLREMLNTTNRCLVGPGVFDGISTKVANTSGFDYLCLTGAGASGSCTGHPDLSVMTASEFANLARMNTYTSDVPVIADADTGFGGPINVARTIALYKSAGVAGVHIEDQTFPKCCGQLKGKEVLDMDEYLERVANAVRSRTDPDFVIIARTDARNADRFGGEQAGDEAFEEGVKRLKAAMECGADIAFMESPRSEDECRRLVKELAPRPVLINILPNSLTPGLTTQQCTDLGFKMVIYPCTGFIPAMLAMQRSYAALKNDGTDLQHCESKTIPDFFEQMGLKAAFDFDQDIVQFAEKHTGPKYGQTLHVLSRQPGEFFQQLGAPSVVTFAHLCVVRQSLPALLQYRSMLRITSTAPRPAKFCGCFVQDWRKKGVRPLRRPAAVAQGHGRPFRGICSLTASPDVL